MGPIRRTLAAALLAVLALAAPGCVSVHADLPGAVAAEHATMTQLVPGLRTTGRPALQARIREVAAFWTATAAQIDPTGDAPTKKLWWRLGKKDLREDAANRALLVGAFAEKIAAGETTPELEIELLRDHAEAMVEWLAMTD